MYIEERTGLEKTILTLNAVCGAFFRITGKVLKGTMRFLAGEPNQNGRHHRQVNS